MNSRIYSQSAALCLFLASDAVLADTIGFVGAGGVQYKYLQMEQRFYGLEQPFDMEDSGELAAPLPVINVQATLFYRAFYATAKAETSLSGSSSESSVPFTSSGYDVDTDVSRDDYSLAFGYRLSDHLSIFSGYMAGETELSPTPCQNCNNAASIMHNDGFGNYRQNYEERGFFAGSSLGYSLEYGRLSSAIALAVMDGQYTDNYRDANGPNSFRYEGDSTGLSLSVSWISPLTDKLFYFLDARVQRYQMDARDESGADYYDGSRVTTEETITGITAGLQWML